MFYLEWQEHPDPDSYYGKYQEEIVNVHQKYFQMEHPLAGIMLTKLRDTIFCYINKQEKVIVPPKPITFEEKDGLQYLSGYIIQKLLKNARKKKLQGVLDILSSMVTETSTQKLIHVQSRGGLTAAIREVNNIITCAEELFPLRTTTGIREININNMIEELFCDVDLVGTFNSIVENAGQSHIEAEIKYNILVHILKLYFKVRAFSLSRDKVARHRLELKSKKANRGLRKTLKEYTNKNKSDI